MPKVSTSVFPIFFCLSDSSSNVSKTLCLLYSGKDQLFPSQEEGERLRHALSKCQIRKFNDNGHFLFLVGFLLAFFICVGVFNCAH